MDQIVEVDPEKLTVTVRRKLEGRKEIVLAKLPALLTVVREINLPRYPLVKRRLFAELAEIPAWTNGVLKLPVDQIGLKGFPTNVKKIFAPERKTGEILGDGEKDPAGAVNLLIRKLAEKKAITAAL